MVIIFPLFSVSHNREFSTYLNTLGGIGDLLVIHRRAQNTWRFFQVIHVCVMLKVHSGVGEMVGIRLDGFAEDVEGETPFRLFHVRYSIGDFDHFAFLAWHICKEKKKTFIRYTSLYIYYC